MRKKIIKVIILALLIINLVFVALNIFADVNYGKYYWVGTYGWEDSDGIVWCPHDNATVKCYARCEF